MRLAHLARFSLALSILAALGGCGSGGDDPRSGPASCPDCLVMPIEVLGAAGTTREAPFALSADPGRARKLHLQIHGLAYQDMASVQVNDGPWVPLSNDTVTVAEPGLRYGGIGGSFATLKLSLDLAEGALRAGDNTLRFRFEKTDGRALGFRVLAFDVLDDAGGSLLSGATKFAQDDPSTWKAPRSAPEDIAAGEALWKDAELSHSPLDGTKLRARCADCHAHDGRDLKYFNYSNLSIIERSKFHGLTEEQGEQIASYIRALPGPAPGRPWNPPYQPGPGLDDKPIEEWSAGAGLEWALDADRETQAHLPGEGESRDALVGPGARLSSVNVRQTPIALQLLDWNHWLPDVHPKDALGDEAYASLHNVKLYGDIRAALAAAEGPDARMDLVRGDLRNRLYDWANSMTYSYDDPSYPGGKRVGLYQAIMPEVGVTAEQFRSAYAGAAWNAVKQWEIMQEFALEGEGPALYGMNGESRSWFANRHVAPHHAPAPQRRGHDEEVPEPRRLLARADERVPGERLVSPADDPEQRQSPGGARRASYHRLGLSERPHGRPRARERAHRADAPRALHAALDGAARQRVWPGR
jgi:cytochrome c553